MPRKSKKKIREAVEIAKRVLPTRKEELKEEHVPLWSKRQLFAPTMSLMSREVAVSRIRKKTSDLMDTDLLLSVTEMGSPWTEARWTEPLRQLFAFFGWPPKKEAKSLVWNRPGEVGPFSSLLLQNVRLERVELDGTTKMTKLLLEWDKPTAFISHTIDAYLSKNVSWSQKILTVKAPTFLEAWVIAGIVAGHGTNQYSRAQIQSQEIERRYLQALGEPLLQDQVVQDLADDIAFVQTFGTASQYARQDFLITARDEVEPDVDITSLLRDLQQGRKGSDFVE